MKHESARTAIFTAWTSAWAAGPLADLPIEHENLPFQRPEGKLPWGRLTYLPGETTPAALGFDFIRTPFALILQIFLPEHSGTAKAYQAADAMSALDGQVLKSGDGVATVYFNTAGLSAGATESGIASFNVTITGRHDINA